MNLEKIKNIFKNQYFILAVITLLALFIRLLNIDKPCGLWYDEMLTYVYSLGSFPIGVIKNLLRYDFHMPLYYLFTHAWMYFFGNDDTVLRYSSVLWGVLTIPAFFYLGKAYKSTNLGLFLALIGCLSPVLIYYSQEFRFYSMLVFFATLALIFLIKLIDNPDKKLLALFCLSNLVILYIYTMGIIFVLIEFLVLLVHFFFYKKDFFKTLLKYSAIFAICTVPYLVLLYTNLAASNQLILDPFIYVSTSPFAMLAIINDWFSPFVACKYGSSLDVYNIYLHNPALMVILTFFTAATICFLIGFTVGLKKINKTIIYLMTISLTYIFTELFLAYTGSLVLMTKYTLICFPIVLLISADGLLTIKSSSVKKTLISIILFIFIYNIVNYQKMSSFSIRPNGYKTLTNELNEFNPNKNDYVLYPHGDFLIKKYLPDTNYVDLNISSAFFLDKSKTEVYKIFDKKIVETTTKKNAIKNLIPFLIDPKPSKHIEKLVNQKINKIPKKGRLFFVKESPDELLIMHKDLNETIVRIFNNETLSKKHQGLYLELVYNKVANDVQSTLDNNPSFKLIKTTYVEGPGIKNKKWKISVYEKQK